MAWRPAPISIFYEEFCTGILDSYLCFGTSISEYKVYLIISLVFGAFKWQADNSFS